MISELKAIVSELSEGVTASEFHAELMKYLAANGFSCKKEIQVPNRGDGRGGRLDLVATRTFNTIAIEIDRMTPRKKSIYKLQHYPCDYRFVVLRVPKQIIEIHA